MNRIAGWRIQVAPQYDFADLASCTFMNVEIADEARAVSFVRNRPDAAPGERIYAVRPLTAEDFRKPVVTGL